MPENRKVTVTVDKGEIVEIDVVTPKGNLIARFRSYAPGMLNSLSGSYITHWVEMDRFRRETGNILHGYAANYGSQVKDEEDDLVEEPTVAVPVEDELYLEAFRVVLEQRKASTSFLQRKLKIGYGRAERILTMLEERGVVGPADGPKMREILL